MAESTGARVGRADMDKAVITCALTGVLTNPEQHPVPVTPKELAASARQAYDAGASIVHVPRRQQTEGTGHLRSWDRDLAADVDAAIRAACPGILINLSTGVVGRDVSGPLACLRRIRPELAACNAGSLNYLKIRDDGSWAWPPTLFDNQVDKVKEMLDAMAESGTRPEFECFDVGIARSIAMYLKNGMTDYAEYNFVMGVASGMPADVDLLRLLLKYRLPDTVWPTTVIGRAEIRPGP